MSKGLRVALVVPDTTYAWNDERQFKIGRLKREVAAGNVDLVVFPEAYDSATSREAQAAVDAWAAEFQAPVLMGMWIDDAFQAALYRNPTPRRGETAKHLYVKHSTSVRLAYEWPKYASVRESMFEPIAFKGAKVGVQLCHDMFFGLIGAKLRSRGATALIDLTGGGVNLSKWTNVARARSLEMGGPFLCTMSRRPNDGGAATALAYSSGRPMVPTCSAVRKDGAGGFVVYDLGDERTEDVNEAQAFSDKVYDDIRLALGGRLEARADISVTLQGRRPIVVAGAAPNGEVRGWKGFTTKKGRTGVLALPLSALFDPLALHREEPPSGAFEHHVVVYGGTGSPTEGDAIALLRLRAIEHRFAVGILTPGIREVLKTNRYKNIQRFKPREDVFGIDANFLGGTFDGARDGTDLGIPQRFMPQYKALLS